MVVFEKIDTELPISPCSAGAFETRTIKELAALRLAKPGAPRLLLPPIQRSLVWSNEQIINYWDSLLRGYPAGMMLFHLAERRENVSDIKGRDADEKTCDANEGDWQLFDGQQRLASVLLGFHEGQLKNSHKLWVDLGQSPEKGSGLKFQLRMSSRGQPFGYQPSEPNQKIESRKRQHRWGLWEAANKDKPLYSAFDTVVGGDIIDAKCAIEFNYACRILRDCGKDNAISKLQVKYENSCEFAGEFIQALEGALNSIVILQRISPKIVSNQDEYVRFFGRIGQGGTRLSEDELTYSIIKNQFPEIHDRMIAIMAEAGQLASEVDLVLAALRVAKTLAPWAKAKEWEVISRPTPTFVSQMTDKGNVKSEFERLMGFADGTVILKGVLINLREALKYDNGIQNIGLPPMLLARMPRELIDTLILFAVKRGADSLWHSCDQKTLVAFVLYWMLFVADDGKAAWLAFRFGVKPDWSFTQQSIRGLIREYEREGAARVLPRLEALPALRKEVEQADHILRKWQERFIAVDKDSEQKPGDALRVLSTNMELTKRALIWLQRDYICDKFPNYDPTSGRDEDLPVDLDHIIPQNVFGFDWREYGKRLRDEAVSDNFRWIRGVVGNSLGNYRWLSASENRSRGDGAYVPIVDNLDLVTNPSDWNALILRDANDHWSKEDIATFQRLINLRSLQLYENLLTKSGIMDVLPDEQLDSSAT